MKKIKKTLALLLAVITLFSTVAVVANAADISITGTDYGYITPTDSKMQKSVSTVKMYGSYDYINFYINAKCDDVYFFFEIYSDKNMTKMVASDYTYCDEAGTYSFTPWLKLKGVFKTGTYYGVAYAARATDDGSVSISEKSFAEFKVSVNRTTAFAKQIVLLKTSKNTVNGPTISWYKHSSSATKYVIYRRSMTGTKWTKVATVNAKTLSYTDKSVKNKNGKYVYTVKALDKKGTASRYQFEGIYCLFAKAPQVSTVATASDNRVQVKWNNTSSSARYNVYRKEGGGKWVLLKSNYKG
ncbi:MAG: fibronectin type III domain-containing protein, partial [Clostridia bacterium]|nr:fibronectin type III domain-containing protein [Clostridia bacterium]